MAQARDVPGGRFPDHVGMTTIDTDTTELLAAGFSGNLLRPGDATYDEARQVYNAMFDRHPALIIQCRNTEDVVAAVNFARGTGLEVAVRAGGHSIAGFSVCEGGIVIDLSLMKHIDVDPDRRIARAQPGVLLGELDAATQQHGLATPLGFISVTGVAGLTLNGGIGWLARKYGLSCDNLVAAEVVLADGSVVRTSDTQNHDLMWGLRGGGGNFGIVTSFEYRLHEMADVFFEMRFYPAGAFSDVLRVLGAHGPALSDDVVAGAVAMTVPQSEMFPEELHGQFVTALLLGYLGSDEDAAKQAFAPFDATPEPLLAMGMTVPFTVAQTMQDDDMPSGRQNYWKAGNLRELTEDAIEVLATHAPTVLSPHGQVMVLLLGGAMGRVGETDTAYCGRDAVFNCSIDNIWEDPAENEAQIAWSRAFYDALTPHLAGGVYLNWASEESADRVRQAYGPNYERLVALKDQYDPTNFFRMNQNIKPSS